ncbi:hypothetical protein ACP4OV_027662 [Aristida adscensionis]
MARPFSSSSPPCRVAPGWSRRKQNATRPSPPSRTPRSPGSPPPSQHLPARPRRPPSRRRPPAAAMYNGVGLQTPRGSGTSGHVQASRFVAKPRPSSSAAPRDRDAADGGVRRPSKDLLEHGRKRQVELRLLVLRDALEEQGYTEAEILERLDEARKAAEAVSAAAAAAADGAGDNGRSPLQGARRDGEQG